MKPITITSYCWTENQFNKDSNIIASCVFDALYSVDLSNYKKVLLISDVCACQNKNCIFIGCVLFGQYPVAPKHIFEIEIINPVTGHSFLPSERVFGFIEKKIKNER